MNTIKIYKYILFLFTITFVISCEDEETLTPEIITIEPNIENEIALDDFISNTLFAEGVNQELIDLVANPNPTEEEVNDVVTSVMTQIQNGVLAIPISENNQIAAYVISNDEGGNFFEELIVQDKATNPTIGVKIMLNQSSLYNNYQIGRKIYVDISNANIALFLGLQDGVLAIGGATEVDGGQNTEVSKISVDLVSQVVLRSTEVATITPKVITLTDVNNETENIFIALEDMQFPESLVFGNIPSTFASNDGDQFQGERELVNCLTEDFIDLSTSTFSSYITDLLPNGQGRVNGILARNFFDDKYILKINEPNDIIFENGIAGRCD